MLMINRIARHQGRASTRIYFIGIVLILIFLATSDAVPPRIWTSVDDYKSVCPEEQIYLTCFTNDSWSLSWTSLDYIGSKAAIEFNQDLDRPGVGKLVSLPNGRATLSQMTKTERSLSSDLKITIPDNLNETQVTCMNDLVEAVTKTFILAREPPALLTHLQTDTIAKSSTTGDSVFRFRWQLPTNIESIDLKYIKFQIDHQLPIILMGNTTEIILSLKTYEQHNVSIVAVDRCSRQSQLQPTDFYLEAGYKTSTETDVIRNGPVSSAKAFNTLNELIILMTLSVFSLFFISL